MIVLMAAGIFSVAWLISGLVGLNFDPLLSIAIAIGVFTLFCTPEPVRDLADAKRSDTKAYAALFHAMLESGFYLPPSQFEVGFVSAAHTEEHVASFLNAAEKWSSV